MFSKYRFPQNSVHVHTVPVSPDICMPFIVPPPNNYTSNSSYNLIINYKTRAVQPSTTVPSPVFVAPTATPDEELALLGHPVVIVRREVPATRSDRL
jgi:hypothetical protein